MNCNISMLPTKKRPVSPSGVTTAKRFSSSWSDALSDSLRDTKLHLFSDDQVVIIRDKFAKSRHHYLLLPKSPIDNLSDVRPENLPLLEHMLERAEGFAQMQISPKTRNAVRYGFHMIPSMKHLHLHIISQDFDSTALKNKKHWNSFTTAFFLDADKVLEVVKKEGRFLVDKERGEKLLKGDLYCHVCKGLKLANIPKLKEHIKLHDKDRSGETTPKSG